MEEEHTAGPESLNAAEPTQAAAPTDTDHAEPGAADATTSDGLDELLAQFERDTSESKTFRSPMRLPKRPVRTYRRSLSTLA